MPNTATPSLISHPSLIIVKLKLPVDEIMPSPYPFGKNPKDVNFFAVLFYLLLSSMVVRQNTVLAESKMITSNASIQDVLNKRNAKITFAILPANAKTATINRVQAENTQYSAFREDIQNSLMTVRQNAKVLVTQTSTNVSLLQQDASMDSGWIQTLNVIFKVVIQMNQR